MTLTIPDAVAERFGKTPEEATRHLLESAAIEAFRSHRLSRGQVRGMLGLSWQQTETFLAQHGCPRHYSAADLDEDRATLDSLPKR